MAGDAQAPRIELAEVMDAPYASRLLGELKALRNQTVEIDGHGVVRCSTLCLQVLASAAATWAADGGALRIINASEPLAEAARTLGLAAEQLPMDRVMP